MVSVGAEKGAEASGSRRGWAILGALMVAYAALFVAFYPPIPGIEDEIGYLNQAWVWSRGRDLGRRRAGYADLPYFFEVAGRHVSGRNPGRSLAALPFLMAGGPRATFASGLLIHLATTAVAGAVLARLGRSPLWAALVLFHPTLSLYSRTIMADEAAGLGLLLAAWAVVRVESPRSGIWAGAAVGLAAVMRYHAGLALPFVAAAFRFPAARARPWRQAVSCLIAGGLCGGLIVAYNLALYGRATDPNPAMHGRLLDPINLVPNARFYASALMLLWPGMLLAPLFDRSILRWLARGVCGFYLAFFLFYYWYDRGGSWAETAVLGLRLIEVALPVWIVSYAGVVDDLVAPLRRPARALGSCESVAVAGCVALTAATRPDVRRSTSTTSATSSPPGRRRSGPSRRVRSSPPTARSSSSSPCRRTRRPTDGPTSAPSPTTGPGRGIPPSSPRRPTTARSPTRATSPRATAWPRYPRDIRTSLSSARALRRANPNRRGPTAGIRLIATCPGRGGPRPPRRGRCGGRSRGRGGRR